MSLVDAGRRAVNAHYLSNNLFAGSDFKKMDAEVKKAYDSSSTNHQVRPLNHARRLVSDLKSSTPRHR